MSTLAELQTELAPAYVSRWSTACERVYYSINDGPARVFGVAIAVYAAVTVVLTYIKLFWFDELITLYIAKLNSIRGVWNALEAGADPNPPLTHVLVMVSTRLLGTGPLAVRLPAILGGLLGLVCLWAFLRKRLPPLYAVVGVGFFLCTAAYDYSYEARSYALTLGFAMLALLSWQRAATEPRREKWLLLMALALAAGISSNYFAVLAFFPIAAGELVRSVERRRIDLPIWAAIAVGGLPFVFYLPLINHAISRYAPYAWNKPKLDVISDSYEQMVEVILWPALAVLAAALAYYLRGRFRGSLNHEVLPRHEAAAVLVQMMYPFLGYGIAIARAGMMSPRFVLPMCYGFAIAVAAASYKLFRRNAVASVLLLVLVFSWLLARNGVVAGMYYQQRQALFAVRDSLPPAATIAVADSLLVLPLYYYSPPDLASHIVFPLDFEAIHRFKKEDSPEQNLWAGRRVFPVPIDSLSSFQQRNGSYLIVATDRNWMVRELAAEQVRVRRLPIDTHSENIGGFTPLCHGQVVMFAVGDPLGENAPDKMVASSRSFLEVRPE